jgi:hypothetical protein
MFKRTCTGVPEVPVTLLVNEPGCFADLSTVQRSLQAGLEPVDEFAGPVRVAANLHSDRTNNEWACLEQSENCQDKYVAMSPSLE